MAERMKRCPACKRDFPIESFVRNRAAPNGIGNYCKPCHNEITRRNRARRHGSVRSSVLLMRYGISEAEADALLKRHGPNCPICGKREARHIDHDHASGAVRGILCFSCNGGLGQFNDDSSRIAAVLDYLKNSAPHGETN